MLNRFSRLAALSACILPMFFSCSDRTPAISNPLDIDFGDPYVLLASDGRYYMYGTGIVQDGFCCYKSDNLSEWEFAGQVYKADRDTSWGTSCFWAPEVYEKDGRY